MPIHRPRVIRKFRYVLVRCRKRKGLTQEQLSERAGVSLSFLSMLEIGQRHPNIEMLFKLALGLGVRPSYLLAELEKEADIPQEDPELPEQGAGKRQAGE